jgi:hypothetical protein
MTTLHDMLRDDPAPPRRQPPQQQGLADLRGRYRTLAMPAVAAAAPYHSGSKDRTGSEPSRGLSRNREGQR